MSQISQVEFGTIKSQLIMNTMTKTSYDGNVIVYFSKTINDGGYS